MRALHGGDVPLVVHPAQLGVSRIRGTRFRFQKEVGLVGEHFLADPSSRVILHTSAEDAGRVAQAAGVKDAGALASTS